MSSQNSQTTKPTQNSPLEGYDHRSGGGLFDVIVGNPPYVRADVDDPKYQAQQKWMENSGRLSQ